jgi:hypothetical protein
VLQAQLDVSRAVRLRGFAAGGSGFCYLGHLVLLPTEAGIATFDVWRCYQARVNFATSGVRHCYRWFEALLS